MTKPSEGSKEIVEVIERYVRDLEPTYSFDGGETWLTRDEIKSLEER